MIDTERRIRDHLTFFYGEGRADNLWPQLQALLNDFQQRNPHLRARETVPSQRLSERDAILITYGDQFQEPGVLVPACRTGSSRARAGLRGGGRGYDRMRRRLPRGLRGGPRRGTRDTGSGPPGVGSCGPQRAVPGRSARKPDCGRAAAIPERAEPRRIIGKP